jgi:hypothetical protein
LKYRKLNLNELEGLQEDFVHFLSANTVTADDWEMIKQADANLAGEMIEVFSDIVWERILAKITYVRLVKREMIRVMYFGEEKVEMIQLKIEDPDFDFSNPDQIRSIAEGTADLKSLDPEMIKGTKAYSESRDLELFMALEGGNQPTDEVFWRAFKSMVVEEPE